MLQKAVTIPTYILSAANFQKEGVRSLPLLTNTDKFTDQMKEAVRYLDRTPKTWPVDFARGCGRLIVFRNQEGKCVIFDLLDLKGEFPKELIDFLLDPDKIILVWNDRAELNQMMNGSDYMLAGEGGEPRQIVNMVDTSLIYQQEFFQKRWWEFSECNVTRKHPILPPKRSVYIAENTFSEYHLYRPPLLHVVFLCTGTDVSKTLFSLESKGLKYMEPLDNGGDPDLCTGLCAEAVDQRCILDRTDPVNP